MFTLPAAALIGAALMPEPPAVRAEPPPVAAQHRPCECQARPCPAGCPDCTDCRCPAAPKAAEAAPPPKAWSGFLNYAKGVEAAERTGKALVVFVGCPARRIDGLVVARVEGLEGIPGPCVTVSAHRKGVSVGQSLLPTAADAEVLAKADQVRGNLNSAKVGTAALQGSPYLPFTVTSAPAGPVQGLSYPFGFQGQSPNCGPGG